MSLLVAAAVLGACTSAGRRPLAPAPGGVVPIQVLLHAEISHGEEKGNVRLTLRRWRRERFELVAADPLGRRLWSVEVAGEEAIWRDAREPYACRLPAAGPVRLGDVVVTLPPRAIPTVLAGALPVVPPPGSGTALAPGRTVEFEDPEGGQWRVALGADGEPLSWRLTTADTQQLSWERRGDRFHLHASRPPFSIGWREATREPLLSVEPAWVGPAPATVECGDASLP